VPISDPWVIDNEDVNIAFSGLGALTPVNLADYTRTVMSVRAESSRFLHDIPVEVSLDNANLDMSALREPIVGLLDCLTAIRGVKLVNATKTIHRHRPRLLPVLDSVIEKYYWFDASIRNKDLFLAFQHMTWGEYGYALIELIRGDLLLVSTQIDQLREAVRGTDFAGASSLRILESLIWYYYAGR